MPPRYRQRSFAVVGDREFGIGEDEAAAIAEVAPNAAARLGLTAARPQLAQPMNPSWRERRISSGTYAADEGMIPMGMKADVNNGTFVAGGPGVITFLARPQKNYRPERLISTLVPVGASVAASRALGQIFVGTDLQSATTQTVDLGMFVPQAFGVRLAVTPGEPGVELTIPVSLTISPTNADTFTVILQWLGRVIH